MRRHLPNSRMYQATLPAALHSALLREASAQREQGGQVNINKVLVQRLYLSMRDELPPASRASVEDFLAQL